MREKNQEMEKEENEAIIEKVSLTKIQQEKKNDLVDKVMQKILKIK